MTAADIVTILGGVGAPLLLLGGGVKWIMGRVDKLDERLKAAERKAVKLEREYGRVLIQVQRWRTAFQLVAGELAKADPKNSTLATVQTMLAEKVPDFDSHDDDDGKVEPDADLLYKMTQGAFDHDPD